MVQNSNYIFDYLSNKFKPNVKVGKLPQGCLLKWLQSNLKTLANDCV